MIWSTVLECDRLKLVIMGHFCPLSPLKPQKIRILKKWKKLLDIIILHMCIKNQSYKVWFLKYGVRRNFLPFWAIFYPFTPPPSQNRKSNFSKIKKASGDVIILHICTKNHYHTMYASWDMECERQFFVILCHFCPFTPLLTLKTKIWEKCKKNPGDTIILHMRTIN